MDHKEQLSAKWAAMQDVKAKLAELNIWFDRMDRATHKSEAVSETDALELSALIREEMSGFKEVFVKFADEPLFEGDVSLACRRFTFAANETIDLIPTSYTNEMLVTFYGAINASLNVSRNMFFGGADSAWHDAVDEILVQIERAQESSFSA